MKTTSLRAAAAGAHIRWDDVIVGFGMASKKPIELVQVPAGPAPPREDLESLLGVEECVRYYPPDLSPATDPSGIFLRENSAGAAREIDIFVDVPFCKTICGFCPFNVYTYDAAKVQAYLDALEKEIAEIQARHDFSDLTIRTVWIGGGTPSVMEESVLDRLLGMLHEKFDLTRVRELTVEIKPTFENLADSKLALLQRHGVKRISMGVQSTNHEFLRILGRGHSAAEAFDVIRRIKGAGFALNIDMMYRLPGQSTAQVDDDIDAVKALGIDHMSWFPYVPHEGTTLADRINSGRVSPQAGRNEYFAMFSAVVERMSDAGFEQYTPYHFAFTERCEYHVGRWKMPQRDTLGLGPGAFGFFNGWIYTNEHDPERYEQAVVDGHPPVMMAKKLTEKERITRLAVLGIKAFVIDLAEFEAHSGVSLTVYYELELDFLQRAGLVEVTSDAVVCTFAGKAFNNDIATLFGTDTARRTRHPQAIELMRLGS